MNRAPHDFANDDGPSRGTGPAVGAPAPPVHRTALITGGSRGLGRALGLALATQGTKVVLVARHQQPLDAAVADLRARGHEAHGIAADVAGPDAATAITAQAAALVGPLDLLVNNASELGPVPLRLLLDTDCEDLTRLLEVNVVAPFRLAKVVAGALLMRGRAGTIVNITSDAAREGYARWGGYGASKAALEQLGRICGAELAGSGVRMLTVDPGEMDTLMHAQAIPDADRATLAPPARVAEAIVRLLAAPPAAAAPGERLAIRLDAGGSP